MRVAQLSFPDGVERPSRRRVAVFRKHILENAEVCDRCFARIRSIGETRLKRTDVHRHYVHDHYERTDDGVQEHDPFHDASDRYGSCYCLRCGAASSTGLADRDRSLAELQALAKNILAYLNCHTPYRADGGRMGRTLARLKREPDNGGLDTEILAVATAVGLESAHAHAPPAPAD